MSDNNFKRFGNGIQIAPGLSADPPTGEIGEIYHNTTSKTLKICVSTSPLIWSELYLQPGTVNNSILTWDSSAFAWTENVDILINQNLITTLSNTAPNNIQIKPGLDTSASNDGQNVAISGGDVTGTGVKGKVDLLGRSVGFSGTANVVDPTVSAESDLYYNSNDKLFRYFDGSNWVFMSARPGTLLNSSLHWDGANWSEDDTVLISSGVVFAPENSAADDTQASFISLVGGNKTAGLGNGGNATVKGGDSIGGKGGNANLNAGDSTTGSGGDVFIGSGFSFGGLVRDGYVNIAANYLQLTLESEFDIPISTSTPEGLETGIIYYNTAWDKFRYYDGIKYHNFHEGIMIATAMDETSISPPTTITSKTIATSSFLTDTTTVNTTAAHGLAVGDQISISGTTVEPWNSGTSYGIDRVLDDGGDAFISIVIGTAIGLSPSSNLTEWAPYTLSELDGTFIISAVNSAVEFEYDITINTGAPILINSTGGTAQYFNVTIDNTAVKSGDLVLFTNLSSNNNTLQRVKESGGIATWSIVPLNVEEDGTPKSGDFVFIQYGDTKKEKLFRYDEGDSAWKQFASGSGSPKVLGGGEWASSDSAFVQEQIGGTGAVAFNPTDFRGGTFVATQDSLIDTVGLEISNATATAGDCHILIYETSGGLPTGSPVATTAAIPLTSLPSVTSGIQSFLLVTPYQLLNGVEYGIVAQNTTGNGNLRIVDTITDVVPGQQVNSTDGIVWNSSPTRDINFRVSSASGISLSFTQDAFIEVKELNYSDNTISTSESPISLPNDEDVAYVIPNDAPAGPNLSVIVDTLPNVPTEAIIIARRKDNITNGNTQNLITNNGVELTETGSTNSWRSQSFIATAGIVKTVDLQLETEVGFTSGLFDILIQKDDGFDAPDGVTLDSITVDGTTLTTTFTTYQFTLNDTANLTAGDKYWLVLAPNGVSVGGRIRAAVVTPQAIPENSRQSLDSGGTWPFDGGLTFYFDVSTENVISETIVGSSSLKLKSGETAELYEIYPAKRIPYTPTTPGDWTSIPEKVSEALDTLGSAAAEHANKALSNLDSPTAINQDLTFGTGTSRSVVIPQKAATGGGDTLLIQAGAPLQQGFKGGELILRAGQSTEGYSGSLWSAGAAILFQSSSHANGQPIGSPLSPYANLMKIQPTVNDHTDFHLGNPNAEHLYLSLTNNTTGKMTMQFVNKTGNFSSLIKGTDRTLSSGSGNFLEIQGGNALTSGAGGNLKLSGGTALGTNAGGGTLEINGGNATGDGSSKILINTVRSGQGTGTTQRTPTPIAEFGDKFKYTDGSEGNIGEVLTQTAADGTVEWQPAPGSPKILGGGEVTWNYGSTPVVVDQLLSNFPLSIGSTGSYNSIGQSFTVGAQDLTVTDIGFQQYNGAGATGNMFMEIFATSGSVPTGPALATSAAIDVSTISIADPGAPITFALTAPYVLTAGVKYAIVLNGTGITGSISSKLYTLDVFANGNALTNSGAWSSLTSNDMAFEIVGFNSISDLTFSNDFVAEIKGLDYADNTILASESPISLPNDEDVAYVIPNKVAAGPNLSVIVDTLNNIPGEAIIIARRKDNNSEISVAQNGGTDTQSYSSITRFGAQSFDPSQSGNLNKLIIQSTRIDNGASEPTGNIAVELWSDGGTGPGALIATANPVDVNSLSDLAFTQLEITFPTAPVISNGTTYWWVVDNSGLTLPAGTGWQQYQNNSAGYANGQQAISVNSGGSWTLIPSVDFNFEIIIGSISSEVIVGSSSLKLKANETAELYEIYPAKRIPYTPTTPGDWSSVPDKVESALDNVMADVAVLAAAGSGADRNLSNLQSPTAINQSLVPNADATLNSGGNFANWAQVYSRNFTSNTGNMTVGTNINTTFSAVFGSGDLSSASSSGIVTLKSGLNSGAGSTGNLIIQSGDSTSANSGDLLLETGNVTAGISGDINIGTGSNDSSTLRTGDINLITGANVDAGFAQTGNINLTIGAGTFGEYGKITLKSKFGASRSIVIAGENSDLLATGSNQDIGSATVPFGGLHLKGALTSPALNIYSGSDVLLGFHTNRTTPSGRTTGGNIYNTEQLFTDAGGDITIYTVPSNTLGAAGIAGGIFLETSNRSSATPGADSGPIHLLTGSANGGSSAPVTLQTGDTNGSPSGNVILKPGANAAGGPGGVALNNLADASVSSFYPNQSGQVFTTSISGALSTLDVDMDNSAANWVYAKIYNTTAGLPSGTPIGVSDAVFTNSAGAEVVSFTFAGAEALPVGTYAWIVSGVTDGTATTEANLGSSNRVRTDGGLNNVVGAGVYDANATIGVEGWTALGDDRCATLTLTAIVAAQGKILLDDSSKGTPGNVWTEGANAGEGSWQPSAGGGGGSTVILKDDTNTGDTLSSGDHVFADSTTAIFTLNLPGTPALGNTVRISDFVDATTGGGWATNNVTVGRNGSTIDSVAADFTLDINGGDVEFIYNGSTWRVLTHG